jgi:hypothetical protein
MTHRASCSCGRLALTCEGPPARVSVCHCLACQRRTGSAFGAQARFAADRVSVSGEAARFVREADSGARVTFSFCPACGATVCWSLEALPGFVSVAVGAFADPGFPAPSVSIYEARRHPWAAVAPGSPGVEHLD